MIYFYRSSIIIISSSGNIGACCHSGGHVRCPLHHLFWMCMLSHVANNVAYADSFVSGLECQPVYTSSFFVTSESYDVQLGCVREL